jgi:cellulose biosynthesis protein BcsQ
MAKTITLCSGKGGVGKTVLAACLARIIQREENCNVILVDLDLSVRGLTLLTFQNKYELDHVPVSLSDYLDGGEAADRSFFEVLHQAIAGDHHNPLPALYRRMEHVFVIPSSTETERPDWTQLSRVDFNYVGEKLKQFQSFVSELPNVGYIIFDAQAGPGALSLAAATLSDMNVIILEEDDISWRAALNLLLEISDLNKRTQRRSRSYFLANKASSDLLDAATKLKAFSFLPPLPYDAYMQKLFAHATAAALEKEFEGTDFFRQSRERVWHEMAVISGIAKPEPANGSLLAGWWKRPSEKTTPRSVPRVSTTARLQLPASVEVKQSETPSTPAPARKQSQ